MRLPSSAQTQTAVLFTALIGANLEAWDWAYAFFSGRTRVLGAVLGTALLAWVFGQRHAVDADHVAAIDNVVRKLMQKGEKPRLAGPIGWKSRRQGFERLNAGPPVPIFRS